MCAFIACVCLSLPWQAFYFVGYEVTKRTLAGDVPEAPMHVLMVSGAVAGVLGVSPSLRPLPPHSPPCVCVRVACGSSLFVLPLGT